MIIRGLLGIFSILSVFFLPWWIVFLIVLALIFQFEYFFEAIVVGVLADVLYGSMFFWGFPYPITLIIAIVLFLVFRFKKSLILY